MSEKTEKRGTFIHGIAASQHLDSSGERIIIDGVDISSLTKDGVFNFEHQSKEASSIVGKILEAKKILKVSDCENDHHRFFWDKIKMPFIYVAGELFDAVDHQAAKDVAAMVRYDGVKQVNKDTKKLINFSIEGSRLEKQGSNITKCIARKVSVTITPCNKVCEAAELKMPTNDEPKEKDSGSFSFIQDIMSKSDEPSCQIMKEEIPFLYTDIKSEKISKNKRTFTPDKAPSTLKPGDKIDHSKQPRAKTGAEIYGKPPKPSKAPIVKPPKAPETGENKTPKYASTARPYATIPDKKVSKAVKPSNRVSVSDFIDQKMKEKKQNEKIARKNPDKSKAWVKVKGKDEKVEKNEAFQPKRTFTPQSAPSKLKAGDRIDHTSQPRAKTGSQIYGKPPAEKPKWQKSKVEDMKIDLKKPVKSSEHLGLRTPYRSKYLKEQDLNAQATKRKAAEKNKSDKRKASIKDFKEKLKLSKYDSNMRKALTASCGLGSSPSAKVQGEAIAKSEKIKMLKNLSNEYFENFAKKEELVSFLKNKLPNLSENQINALAKAVVYHKEKKLEKALKTLIEE